MDVIFLFTVMAGCCLRCFSCFLAYSALVLLGVFFHDVEASSCDRIIHKKVGDTVELSSCLPTEGNLTLATWKFKDKTIIDTDVGVTKHSQFLGRVELNQDSSLTVRELKTQDSGVYSFISLVNDQQRPTVFITLQVHEIITQQPSLTVNSTWHALNESCTVVGKCSAASDTKVSYNWTVRGQTHSGSRLQYNIQPEDGDIEFTCTIFNFVSNTSASKTVKCSNSTSTDQDKEVVSSPVQSIIRVVIGIALTVLLLFLLCYYTKSKDLCGHRSCFRHTESPPANQDETQQQVYSSLLHGDGSVYESVRGSEDAGKKMAGCCLRCFSCFLAYSALVLLGVFFHDVEASSCDRIIHKKVGDTVELSSCLPTEGVTSAIWKYKDEIVIDTDIGVTKHPQFIGRVELNQDSSLTVKRLKTQDSGVYSFISEVNDQQRPTVSITLQVHEIITQQPSLTVNSTWHALNESCTVVGECSAASDTKVSYNWTVRGQTHSGSRLQYNIQPEDGDIKFICTIFNFVSNTSASKTVKCSNSASTDQDKEVVSSPVQSIIRVVIGIALTVLLLFLLCYYTKSKDLCGHRLV
ncbi:neurosecretory protein VGF-like [Scomber scombrus]|uniref:Neurosecretory protein VGF-like n=1 Tax=Scomber scombrus TaxID=13677 RepID=A0AAV1QM90_SCOSC